MSDLSQFELRGIGIHQAVDAINHAFVVYDANERFRFCNQKHREWYAPIEHLLTPGRPMEEILRAWYGIIKDELTPALTEDEYVGRTIERHRRAAGVEIELPSRRRWVAVAEHRMPDGGVVALRRDITRLKQAEDELRESEARFKALTELSADWYWEQDAEFRFTRFEGRMMGRFIRTPDNFGKCRWDFPCEPPEGGWGPHKALLEAHQPFQNLEYVRVGDDGGRHWLSVSGEPRFSKAGEFRGYRGVTSDITQRKEAELKLARLARYDELTGLANRHLLAERIHQGIALAQRESCHCAVLFIDLDRVRRVNNSLGHVAGDALLTEISRRIVHRVRETDTVGRRGGDEFIVVLPMIPEPAAAAHVAKGILRAISEPLSMSGAQLHVTASIGIAVYPDDGEDQQTLIQRADAAMYFTKAHGRNGYHFYTPAMHERVNARLGLEARMRAALELGQFTLVYQPQLSMAYGNITGVEALLRWNDPVRGQLLPSSFIDVAEETGLILKIGEWALNEACAQACGWVGQAGHEPPPVAVNISALQFQQPDLPAMVNAVLARTGLPPHRLELEVTETSLMRDSAAVLEVLDQLRASGISIAIDDFGSGYSSLGYLKRFPIDKLKIDQNFIAGCAEPGNDSAIASAIIALGRALNLTVVAEGVETEPQLAFLRAGGCEVAQGFKLSRPLDADAIRELLATRVPAPLSF
jgi:diguanylate cyclase (GGDEF)-like protein